MGKKVLLAALIGVVAVATASVLLGRSRDISANEPTQLHSVGAELFFLDATEIARRGSGRVGLGEDIVCQPRSS